MGQTNVRGKGASSDVTLVPVNYEQLTSLSSAAGLTAAKYDGASAAVIQAEDQNVRWRDDGTDPTASVGMQLTAGNDIWYTGSFSAIKLIEETASAKLNVTYYRPLVSTDLLITS